MAVEAAQLADDCDDGETLNPAGELRRDVRRAVLSAAELPKTWQGKPVKFR